MKAHYLPLIVLISSHAAAQDGVLDLTAPANYAAQPVPNYIQKDNTPANNPITDYGATLGRVLFYDVRLSTDSTISCASCHQQENGFGDLDLASTGVDGTTGRHSMRLINSRFSTEQRFFWDERAATLEAQSTQPIQDHVEMGFSGEGGDPDFSDLVTRLSAIEEYQVMFRSVYGDETITEGRVQQVLAQFVRSIQSFDSKYDTGRAQVGNGGANFPNYTASENRGKNLYLTAPQQGGAGCNACHNAPEFDIDPNSRSNGVVGSIGGGTDTTNTRSPSLRDLADADGNLNGGLMHNAIFNSLRQAIDHYNAIPNPAPANLDPRLAGGPGGPGGPGGGTQQLNLTETEKTDLENFLLTLSGTSVYADPKWASPFNAAGNLSLIVLPTSIATISVANAGEVTEMVTVSTPGVPNIAYLYSSSSDLATWTEPEAITADANGVVSVTRLVTAGKQFYRIGYAVAD
ncbi:hypothetical protein N9Z15_06000 [Akkermansiaceae bacterium]|nr:hypothetical protein [Akkermansiaceae bacterium]